MLWTLVPCPPNITKKRIRELLSIAEVLDDLHYEQKAHGISMSISAFLRSEVEIVQISAILEKQKRYAIYMLFNQLFSVSFIKVLSRFHIIVRAVCYERQI